MKKEGPRGRRTNGRRIIGIKRLGREREGAVTAIRNLMKFCFVLRYKMLVKGPSPSDNSKAVCAGFLQTYDSSKKEWQLGKTKVLHQCGEGCGFAPASRGCDCIGSRCKTLQS